MKKMNMLWTKIAAIALGAILTVGVGATLSSVLPAREIEAATSQDNRRIYVYLEGGWDNAGHMFIHYWGGAEGTTWKTCPEMTNVVSDYFQGLFYYDVPIDVTDFCVKDQSGNVSKTSNQSIDIAVADLFVEPDYKVATVKAWVKDEAKREAGVADNAPMSSPEAAAVLNHINSCSTSYAGGYNAWPQLNDLFISPSTLDGSTVVTDNFGPDTTIAAKIGYLQERYTDQSPALNVIAMSNDEYRQTIIIITSVIGLTLLTGSYFFNRKKKINY